MQSWIFRLLFTSITLPAFAVVLFAATVTGQKNAAPAAGARATTRAAGPGYVAPTANLTAVANALALRHKSLTTILEVRPNQVSLTQPINVEVTYISPASGRQRRAGPLVASRGVHFYYWDLEGDGKPRRMFIEITLSEAKTSGGFDTFQLFLQADLDPLYIVKISPLTFRLVDDCDRFGASEVLVGWLLPDRTTSSRSYKMRAGANQAKSIAEFAWIRDEISAKAGMVTPYSTFLERDPGLTVDAWFGLVDRFQRVNVIPPLIPGKSQAVKFIKKAENESCRGEFSYRIDYGLRQPASF